MTFPKSQVEKLEDVLRSSLLKKLRDYKPESSNMPFHTRLLGKDRLALFSFIQSLNTTFGTAIFEPIAKELALVKHVDAKNHMSAGNLISEKAHTEIQHIMDSLTTASSEPNKKKEIQILRQVCTQGNMVKVKPTLVDIMIKTHDDEIYLFDIKTAKPNAGGFKEYKRTLLEWAAAMLAQDPKIKIHTVVAIPYNPYEPKPYNRWTIRGMLDLKEELMVANEFWDFLGGKGAYEMLLGVFERIGIELKSEIDQAFKKFK